MRFFRGSGSRGGPLRCKLEGGVLDRFACAELRHGLMVVLVVVCSLS